jgi:hypothetical protein
MIGRSILVVFTGIASTEAFIFSIIKHFKMTKNRAVMANDKPRFRLTSGKPNVGRGSSLFAKSDSTVVTERVALGEIFDNGRKYLFSTKINLRSFEWSTDEAETLFDDIMNEVDDDNPGELELNAINIIRKELTDEEEGNIGKPCALYDVGHRIAKLPFFDLV